MQVTVPAAGTDAEAWEALTAAFGLKGLAVGQHTPSPGIVAVGAVTYPGGEGMVAMNLYLYGDQAADAVARATPVWQAFLQERFPKPAQSNTHQ